jgi:hypothetical protein
VSRGIRAGVGGAALLLAAATPAVAIQGNYIGSFHHSEGTLNEDVMQHRFDLGTRDDLGRHLFLDMRLFLTLDSRPGEADADVFRSRVLGDLRHPLWRLTAQYSPWQRTSISSDIPRDRRMDLQFRLNPPGRPQLDASFRRTDREAVLGKSYQQDWRLQVRQDFRGWSPFLSYRRLETASDQPRSPSTGTDEWRGGVSANTTWRRLRSVTNYDAVYSRFSSLARRRETYVQHLDETLNWSPAARWQVGGTGFLRWGKNDDNQFAGIQEIHERSLSGRVGFVPGGGFSLAASREYRKSGGAVSDLVSDFARFEALFRRDLRRRVAFQAGYLYSVEIGSINGGIPASTGYVLLDGALRRGLAGKVELRGTRRAGIMDPGIQWRRLAELRTVPVARSRADVLLVVEDLPGVGGEKQTDRSWELNLGYQPVRRLDLSTSYRRLDGHGYLERAERYGSVTASWRGGQRTSLSFTGSKRVASTLGIRSESSVVGGDLTFWLPSQVRLKTSVRRSVLLGTEGVTTYGLIVERSFQ